MKRIWISLLAAAFLLASMIVPVQAQGEDLVVSGSELLAGERVFAQVRLTTRQENIVNFQFSFDYDPAVLRLVSAEQGEGIVDAFTAELVQSAEQGFVRLGGTALSGQTLAPGTLLTMEFETLKEADPKVSFEVVSFSADEENGPLPFTARELSVALEGFSVKTSGVAIRRPDSTDLKVGDELQLEAEVTPAGAAAPVWRSSDESVVTVDENGKIKAVGEGQATVTAQAGDFEDSILFTVSRLPGTGDQTPILILSLALLLSGALLTGLLIRRKRSL